MEGPPAEQRTAQPLRHLSPSLRTVLALLVIVTLLPAIVFVILSSARDRDHLAHDAQEHALDAAQMIALRQASSVATVRQMLSVLARHPAIQQGDAAACRAFLSTVIRDHPEYTNINVTSADGTILCRARPLPSSGPFSVRDRPVFQRLMATGDFAVGDYSIAPVSGHAAVGFGFPVFAENGALRGGVFTGLDLSSLDVGSLAGGLPKGSSLTLLDRNGTVLARYPDSSAWTGRSVGREPVAQAALARTSLGTAQGAGLSGDDELLAYGPVTEPGPGGIYIIAGVPRDIAFAPARERLVVDLLGLILAGLLALGAAFGAGEAFFVRRIGDLVLATRRLAEGDFATRTAITAGPGEIRELSEAFDQMAASLQGRESERARALNEHEQLLVEQQAREVAEAATRRRTAEYLVGRSLTDLRALPEAAAAVLQTVGQFFEWDLGAAWIQPAPAGLFKLTATWFAPAARDAARPAFLESVSVTDGPFADARITGQPVCLTDHAAETFRALSGTREGRLETVAIVPLTAKQGVLGVLAIGTRRRFSPTTDDLQSLATIGAQLGHFAGLVHAETLLRELSTPLLPIGERILLAPVIGQVSAERVKQLTDRVLAEIRRNRVRALVIDLTGVGDLDAGVAALLVQTAVSVRLLGARTIVTGLSSAVCEALVALGVDLGQLETVGDLHSGVELAESVLRARA